MKAFLLATFLLSYVAVSASTFYISAVSGNDARTATQAQSAATPWKTLSKLNSYFINLQPGDSILLKRGETFPGFIIVSKSGTANNPIVIGDYGSGNKPMITGLTNLGSFVSIGNNTVETTCTNCPPSLNLITINDTLQPIGRLPKLTDTNGGYWTINSHTANTIQSSDLAGKPSFTGGEIVMRKYSWILDRATINAQNASTITLTPQRSPRHPEYNYEAFDGHGFFIQNHPATFTKPGDWSYDKTTKKLKVFQLGTGTVKATTVENLVTLYDKQFITFSNLALTGANSKAFNIRSCNNIQINNCDINLSGVDAINFDTDSLFQNIVPDSSLRQPVDPHPGEEYNPNAPPQYVYIDTTFSMLIQGCNISNTNNNAIFGSHTYKTTIQNNVFKNTGRIRGMGLSGDGQYVAMHFIGSKSLVQNNEVLNTGYIGIHISGDSILVRNNFVDSFCLVKSDGGGIYMHEELKTRGKRVIANIITNGIGDRFGLGNEIRDNPFAGNVHGIYLDNKASHILVDSNTVANSSGAGLEISASDSIKAINNTFYNNSRTQVDYLQVARVLKNLTVKNNILFSVKSEQLISIYNSGSNNNISTWGVIDSNYYSRPISEPQGVDTGGYSKAPSLIDYPDGGIIQGPDFRFYSLDKWKVFSGQDANSKITPPNVDPSVIHFEYNATKTPKTIALGGQFIDVKNQLYNNSVTLQPYTSVILIKKTGTAASQTITFNPIPNKTFGDPAFSITATASSGLPVTFRVVSGPASVSGNTITLTGSGSVIIEATQAGNGSFNAAPPVQQSFTVAPAPVPSNCNNTGSITRDQWNNIQGIKVSDIPLQSAPTLTTQLSMLETQNTGDAMGARMRGYICPPISGNYTFYLAGDDGVELYSSTTSDPANKVMIAGYDGWTGFREFNKYPSQKSALINLQAGQSYYIEVLHKNGYGGDNMSVKWDLPNGTTELPIPGSRLSPFTGNNNTKANQTITFNPLPSKTFGDPAFTISATATSGLPVNFTLISGPASLSGNTVTLTGTGTVTIQANQAGNTSYNAAPPVSRSFVVNAANNPSNCSATGSITREQWNNIQGIKVSDIPLQSPPTLTTTLGMLETQNTGETMGARMRGYVCPPVSGNYTFYIAGDDGVELYLSSNNDPANKVMIAGYDGWTGFREFNKYPGQKSALINLQAGQSYYIEVLHKNGYGGDNMSVKWDLPNGTTELPIPGSRLSPFSGNNTKTSQTITFSPIPNKTFGDPAFNLNASATSGLTVSFRVVSGPASVSGNTVTLTGSGNVTIEASQAGNSTYFAAVPVSQSFTVAGTTTSDCNTTGTITRDQWTNIFGTAVSDIPLQSPPNNTGTITMLETQNTGGDMGARIKGYLCPPITGNYTFYLSGDDGVELYLSSNNDAANKVKIAGYVGWTGFREFNKYPTQKSVPINLVSGQSYYIEVLHKNGGGGDHVSVKWDLPNGTTEVPIPGSRLSPIQNQNQSRPNSIVTHQFKEHNFISEEAGIFTYPNPFKQFTTIGFIAPESGEAQLEITDITGRPVQRLFKGNVQMGIKQQFSLNANGLSHGIYIVRLVTKTKVISKKITLAR